MNKETNPNSKKNTINKYSLKNKKIRGGEKVKYTKKIYTTEEIRQLLNGYIKVPKEQMWEVLPVGTQIRYYTSASGTPEFRIGGYIKLYSDSKKGKYIIINGRGNRNNKRPSSWAVNLKNIHTMYKREDDVTNVELEELNARIRNLELIIQKIVTGTNTNMKVLETRISKLEQ